jgi:hypothetical protein
MYNLKKENFGVSARKRKTLAIQSKAKSNEDIRSRLVRLFGISGNSRSSPILTDCPHLPIEFCRISQDGRLTLVIDESVGVSCITYSAAVA